MLSVEPFKKPLKFLGVHLITHFFFAALLSRKLGISYFAALFALLPDIDFLLPTHRKFTHSLAALFLCFPLAALFGLWREYLLGFASHLILDMLTPLGVQLLWPYPYHFVILGGKGGKKLEFFILALAIVLNLI